MEKSLLKILSFVCAAVLVLSTFAYANGLVNPFATYEGLTLAATVRTPVGVPLDLNSMGVKFPENTLVAPNQLENLKVKSVMTGFSSSKAASNIPTDAISYQTQYAKLGGIFLAYSNSVYFTFDCGYEGGVTNKILDTLKEKNVRAVFFVTGTYARDNQDLVRRMIAEGHVVGNHTWSHPDCPQKNLLEVQEDIFKCNQYVKDTFNYDMKLFRYPYGYFSEMLLKFIGLQGFVQLFWSYGYRDWVVNEQPDEALSRRNVINAACPGMIYLLHAESTTNANILGDCIDGIRAKGFLIGDCADFLKY